MFPRIVKKSCAFADCCTKGSALQWDGRGRHRGSGAETGSQANGKPRLPQRHGDTERRQKGISPVFGVNADSKKLSLPVNHLESTLAGALVHVAYKGFNARRMRLKTGKTRCLSVIARSKGLRSCNPMRDAKCASERGEISGAWAAKESGDPLDARLEMVGAETKVWRREGARVRRG